MDSSTSPTHDIQLVCFDLNETLIYENTWRDLNRAMGVSDEEDRVLMKLYEDGIITYDQGQALLLELYKKRGRPTRSAIMQAISTYTYKTGAREVVKYLQQKQYPLALISGSMNVLVEKVAAELGISYYASNNTLVFDAADQLIDIVSHPEPEAQKKVELLQGICTTLAVDPAHTVYIGDGMNDKKVFELCQHGITFTGSPLKPYAWKEIWEFSQLKEIL